MTDKIRVVYPDMEDMCRAFEQGVESLQDTLSESMAIANVLEEGALLGEGGSAFVDAIQGKLAPAISRLIEKFKELDTDVNAAMQHAKDADRTAKGQFND